VGTFECWKYTIDTGRIVSRAWFACDLPGPPILKSDTVDGIEVASMTRHTLRRPGRQPSAMASAA
ncbi:MAG: hypothetical protein MUP76_10610, partial [Acidimicrobiia bacterium]|nr:hypothetical protein [Acidimicrobiia bacterium]